MSLYNMLHGVNPLTAVYLAMLGLKVEDVPRFRDTFLYQREDGTFGIAIYTRMGGGNRGHWEYLYENKTPGPECPCPGCRAIHMLGKHPLYEYDEDDSFVSTYATYYFRAPEKYAEVLAQLAELDGQTTKPEDTWQRTLAKLEAMDESDPETKRLLEAAEPLIDALRQAVESVAAAPRERAALNAIHGLLDIAEGFTFGDEPVYEGGLTADEIRSRMDAANDALEALLRDEEPREYDTAAEAIHEAQERADREGRTAFVWYTCRARWVVRDTEPTEADYAEGWMLAARAPARRSRQSIGAEG